MIHYVNHQEIDKEKWDFCVQKAPNCLIYAFSWYLDVVAGEWDALIEDDYISVFPLPVKKKFGIKYAIQPLWTQQLGLFSTKLVTPEKSIEFLNVAMKNVRYLNLNMNSLQTFHQISGYNITSNNNYQLDCIISYELLSSGYSENLKRNLKKAGTSLTLLKDVRPEDIILMFRSFRGKNLSLLNEKAYSLLGQLYYRARHLNKAHTFGMFDETNTLLCGAIFLFTDDRATMIFSAVCDEGKKRHAMHAMIDGLIKRFQQHQMTFDFEGSNEPSLARFYNSFGAKNTPYSNVISSKLPLPPKFIERIRSL